MIHRGMQNILVVVVFSSVSSSGHNGNGKKLIVSIKEEDLGISQQVEVFLILLILPFSSSFARTKLGS